MNTIYKAIVLTFLEFVIAKYLGAPIYSRGNGESHWDCPQCGSSSFHSMPDRPEFKHRFKCWKCNFRGDVLDAIAHFEPALTYGQRLTRLDELRAEFERDSKTKPVASFPRGAGTNGICLRCRMRDISAVELEIETFGPSASSAVDELIEQQVPLSIAKTVLEICARYSVHPSALANAVGFEEWSRDWESRHMAECDDSQCTTECCRRARGWSDDEIREDQQRMREECLAS